jgi:hypothetical protein
MHGIQTQLIMLTTKTATGNRSSAYSYSMYSDPGYLCQSFGKFFSNRVTNLHASLLAKLTNTSPHPNSSHQMTNLSNFPPASVDQVCKLSSQCPATSGELDPVPTTLLHHCISVLPTTTYIINLSFKLGDFPLQFKSCFVHRPLKKSTLDGETSETIDHSLI